MVSFTESRHMVHLFAACLLLVVTLWIPSQAFAAHYGVYAAPEYEIYRDDNSLYGDPNWKDYELEAAVKITNTVMGRSSSGIIFYSDESYNNFYYFGIFPNQNQWKIVRFKNGVNDGTVTSGGSITFAVGTPYVLKVSLSGLTINYKITDKTSSAVLVSNQVLDSSGTRNYGKIGLRIVDASTQFDDITVKQNGLTIYSNDFSSGSAAGWFTKYSESWSVVTDGANKAYQGTVLLSPVKLASPAFSTYLEPHFKMMEAAGVTDIRVFFDWSYYIQPISKDFLYWDDITKNYSNFNWLYLDTAVIVAHNHRLAILPALVSTPRWASKSGDSDNYYAYPPSDYNNFIKFVQEAVNRYKPGGVLANAMNWLDKNTYGATYYECGHEINIPNLWSGTLDEYVNYLQVCHDAIKQVCPSCIVLNGAVVDEADGWQDVINLYTKIEGKPYPNNNPDNYFDILNIHSYQVNNYYSVNDWYTRAFSTIIGVMNSHGDSEKKIWLTELAYASSPLSTHFVTKCRDEQCQADALATVYSLAKNSYPRVENVVWWISSDGAKGEHEFTGLVRGDMTPKPAYWRYGELTGKFTSLVWSSSGWEWSRTNAVSVDINGDGKKEIAAFYNYGNSNTALWIFDPKSDGSGYNAPRYVWSSGVGNWDYTRMKIASVDVNGDGKTEIAAFYNYGNSNTALFIFDPISTPSGSGYSGPRRVWYSGAGNWDWSRMKITPVDINGDHKTEIAAFYNYGNANTGLWIFDPVGSGYSPRSVWSSGWGNWDYTRMMIAPVDVNGDGKTEIAAFYNYGGTTTGLFLFDPSGSGYTAPRMIWSSNGWEWSRMKIISVDVNGDGKTEIAAFYNYGGTTTGLWIFYPANLLFL